MDQKSHTLTQKLGLLSYTQAHRRMVSMCLQHSRYAKQQQVLINGGTVPKGLMGTL